MLTILFIFSSALWTDAGQSKENEQIEYVSILQLVVTPERFDGKLVWVIGYLSLNKERNELYIGPADEANGILENGVSVMRTRQLDEKRDELNLKYVKIVGRFKLNSQSKTRFGHFTNGDLAEIQSCELWSDPEHPFKDRVKLIPGVSPDR